MLKGSGQLDQGTEQEKNLTDQKRRKPSADNVNLIDQISLNAVLSHRKLCSWKGGVPGAAPAFYHQSSG